jgi:lipopolysaccharide biosynthesis glycosyltransferase
MVTGGRILYAIYCLRADNFSQNSSKRAKKIRQFDCRVVRYFNIEFTNGNVWHCFIKQRHFFVMIRLSADQKFYPKGEIKPLIPLFN